MGVTHETIAQQLNLARTTVTRILNSDPSYRASEKTRKKVFALARDLNYDFSNLRRIHRRKYERVPVDIPVYVKILLSDETVFDEGRAKLLDLSPIGGLLGDFKFHKQVIPATPFSLGIEIIEGELAAAKVRARITRISMPDGIQMGVEFDRPEPEILGRIKNYLGFS